MIPLRDDIPSVTRPFFNYLLILTCVVVFLYMLSLGSRARIEAFAMAYGAIPAEIVRRREPIAGYAAIVTSLFMHGGWVHLLGNMLSSRFSATTSRTSWATAATCSSTSLLG